MLFILILLSAITVNAIISPTCNPICSWDCEQLVVPADCKHQHHHGDNHCDRDNCQITPNCTSHCNNNTYVQTCFPKCLEPVCQVECQPQPAANCSVYCAEPVCKVVCDPNQCKDEYCPACETVCQDPVCKVRCFPTAANCTTTCNATECSWDCIKPKNIHEPKCSFDCGRLPHHCKKPEHRKPHCHLNCVQPACPTNHTCIPDHHHRCDDSDSDSDSHHHHHHHHHSQ